MRYHPKKWAEMSFEYKCMFGFHVCMIIMLIAGNMLTMPVETGIAIGLFLAFIFISIKRRLTMQWRWGGISSKQISGAILSIILTTIMLLAISSQFTQLNPSFLPFYFAVMGIGLFNAFVSLKLVTLSEIEFLEQCETYPKTNMSNSEIVVSEAAWKKTLRILYRLFFILVWLDGMGFFYLFGIGMRDGSPVMTPTQTEQLFSHGQVAYITSDQKHRIDLLERIMMTGIPCAMIAGVLLHFLIGGLFPNAPTLEEIREKRSRRS